MRNPQNIPWELIISSLKQNISEDDQVKLSAWLNTAGHQDFYAELNKLWDSIQENASQYNPNTEYYEKKLLEAVASSPNKLGQKHKIKIVFKYLKVACIILFFNILLFKYLEHRYLNDHIQHTPQTFTSIGGKTKIILADSTTVWLQNNSTLSYDKDFLQENRKVKISGEVFFEVTHNKSPFIVEVNDLSIKVHGTKFNVKSDEKLSIAEISLIEGSVEMNTSEYVKYLLPGQKGIYNTSAKSITIEKANVALESSWANESLSFNQSSLDEICLYLSKWYSVEIILDPDIEQKYRYTFMLRNEPLEEIIRLMTRIHPINYSFSEDNVLTINSKH